jgi:hypothetical protein
MAKRDSAAEYIVLDALAPRTIWLMRWAWVVFDYTSTCFPFNNFRLISDILEHLL